MEPNRSSIEETPEIVYKGTIAPDLPTHVEATFEDVCQEVVWTAIRRGVFEPYSEVSRWWYGEDEIDIVILAPNDHRILFVECNWTSDPVDTTLVADL